MVRTCAAVRTSGAPVPAVARPRIEAVAMSAILASVTVALSIVMTVPTPLTVTSP